MFIKNFQNNIKLEAAGDGNSGGGGGGGGGGDGNSGGGNPNAKFTQADIDKAIETAVAGLKANKTEILDEKKKLEDRLKAFGDIDPTKAKELFDLYENNEDMKLIKEGKVEELIAKKTSKDREKYEQTIKDLAKEMETYKNESIGFKNKYNYIVVNHAITKAAIEAGVRKEATDDVVAAAMNMFTVGEDGEVEARDNEGNLRRIGDKIMDITNWIDSLKTSKPHYWPESQGAGLQGNRGNQNISGSDLNAKINAAAAAGDMATYRRLRQEQLKGKK